MNKFWGCLKMKFTNLSLCFVLMTGTLQAKPLVQSLSEPFRIAIKNECTLDESIPCELKNDNDYKSIKKLHLRGINAETDLEEILLFPNLEFLDLSENGLQSLKNCSVLAWHPKLKRLSLNMNNLADSFTNLSICLSQIEELHFGLNNLEIVPSGYFSKLKNLRDLYLGGKLRKFHDRAFEGLDKLEYLRIEEHKVTEIPEKIFRDTPNLQRLVFWNGPLKEIPEGLFRATKKLKWASFWNNEIVKVHPNTYINLPELERINLGSNLLENLPDSIFANLKQLKWLILSNNRLIQLPSDLFKDLESLQYLHVGYNGIKELSDQQFVGLNSLIELTFYHNRLTHFSPQILNAQMENLVVLGLQGNPINVQDIHQLVELFGDIVKY